VNVSGRGRLVSGKESRQETRHGEMESISCEEEFPYCEKGNGIATQLSNMPVTLMRKPLDLPVSVIRYLMRDCDGC